MEEILKLERKEGKKKKRCHTTFNYIIWEDLKDRRKGPQSLAQSLAKLSLVLSLLIKSWVCKGISLKVNLLVKVIIHHAVFSSCSSICSVEKKRKNMEAIESKQNLKGRWWYYFIGFLYDLLSWMPVNNQFLWQWVPLMDLTLTLCFCGWWFRS